MSLIKKPTTGMKDIMPAEMQIRDYVTALVKETYKTFGFTPIETPAVEHIENLLLHLSQFKIHSIVLSLMCPQEEPPHAEVALPLVC